MTSRILASFVLLLSASSLVGCDTPVEGIAQLAARAAPDNPAECPAAPTVRFSGMLPFMSMSDRARRRSVTVPATPSRPQAWAVPPPRR